mgnify:CR=1 FL=1
MKKPFLAFEMGYDQREALSALAKEYFPQAKICVHKDMSGKDRNVDDLKSDSKTYFTCYVFEACAIISM